MAKELERLLPSVPGSLNLNADGLDPAEAISNFKARAAELRTCILPGMSTDAEEWSQYIPVATELSDATGLCATITQPEVQQALFGSYTVTRCDDHPNAQHCTLCDCDTDKLDGDAGKKLLSLIATSKAAGIDGLVAELLKWPRPIKGSGAGSAAAAVASYRTAVSTAVAEALDGVLQSGVIPPSFREHITTPLHKSGDATDPNNYRGVTVANLMDKVLDTIMTRRITHWAHRNKLISREKIGFKSGAGAEQHVATLLETLGLRRRAGENTYLLFLDLQKAYDEVHLESLWLLLRKMGMPQHLCNLLHTWGTSRVTRLRIDGALSEEFPLESGVPQGSVMSPILFNLFIEPLSRYLGSHPNYHGATIRADTARGRAAGDNGTFTLRHLLYCDDLTAMATSTAQLQILANAISRWCTAWGMKANLKEGKTEIMYFPGRGTTECYPRPVYYNGSAIGYTSEYRYLGFPLRSDLDRTHFTAQQIARVATATTRYLRHNPMRHRLALHTQRQIANTLVHGQTTYCTAVAVRPHTELDSIDVESRRAAALLIGAPATRTTTLYPHFVAGLPTATGTEAQHGERMLATARLERPTERSIFADTLAVLQLSSQVPSSLTSRATARRNRATALGVPLCEPLRQVQVRQAAAQYGARLGLANLQHQHSVKMGAHGRQPFNFLEPPPAAPTRLALAASICGPPARPSDILLNPMETPISILHPNGRGGLAFIANTPGELGRNLTGNSLGVAGIGMPPWRITPRRGRRGDAPAEDDAVPAVDGDDDPVEHDEAEFVVLDRPCPLCKHGSDHAYHYFFECSAAELQLARRHLQGGLTTALRSLLNAVYRHGTRLPGTPAQRLALPLTNCTTPEGRAIAYRLLCGLPYPARVVDAVAAPAAHLVGELFDALGVETSRLRGMASTIVAWAAKHTGLVADARRTVITNTWPLNGRRHNSIKVSGRYPDGGTAPMATLPSDVAIRWRHPDRNAECTHCDVNTTLNVDVPCLRCPRTRHRLGHPRCSAPLSIPQGAEWACPSCADEIDGVMTPLGNAQMQPAVAIRRTTAPLWLNPTLAYDLRFAIWHDVTNHLGRTTTPPGTAVYWPLWPNTTTGRQPAPTPRPTTGHNPTNNLERWMAPPRATVYWPLWPNTAAGRQPPSNILHTTLSPPLGLSQTAGMR